MSNPKKNKKLIETFCNKVFINHDLSTLDQLMWNDYIQHNADVPQGKAGFRQFFEATFKAMPDFKYTLKQIVADGDLVWIYCTTSGTHTGGEWLGIPATGNRLNFDVVDMFRIQDGLIAEHWDVADTYSLFSQLGKIK
jgi:predicted SnoaL-like aldol condensation-catalyzing enzyme